MRLYWCVLYVKVGIANRCCLLWTQSDGGVLAEAKTKTQYEKKGQELKDSCPMLL